MGRKPDATDGFMGRICVALDKTPREVAKAIGVSYSEVKPFIRLHAHEVGDLDRDEVWWKISAYVSLHTGMLLAVKQELNKGLQKQRVQRVKRMARFQRYHGA